jgi:hypothetical protein
MIQTNRLLFGINILMLLLMFNSNVSYAQLTGIKTIPGDYIGIAAAVTDLNVQGVGSGGVTFNVAAGHTETLSGKITMTATGTAANPIIFQKSGAGANPVLTSYVGTVATPSVLADGFWVFAGSDYVTIDGIDLQESATNTTTTTVMEFGFGLFKASDTDGCQNNTIQNCNITLNRIQNTAWTAPGHNGSVGIAVLNGLHTATGTVTVTAASGSNSFNRFYSNTIQNCNAGIVFVGFAATSPFTLGDNSNDIGGNSLATGNNILNFGGGAVSNPATGIFANAQWDFNVSYNTINNNNGSGINHATTMRGIFMNTSSTSANANCNFNTITLTGGATTSDLTFIENGFGSTPASNTININNNTLTGSYPTATSGAFRGIYSNGATPEVLNIQNNTISNLTYAGAAQTGTGLVYPIHTIGSNTAMTLNITGNTVSNISRIGTTGGTTIGIFASGGTTGMQININNNSVQNLSIDGAGTASILYGIQSPTGTITVNNNLVDGLTCVKTTGTSAMYGIYNVASPVNENFNENIIRNLNHRGTGTVYGLFANTTTGTRTVSGNLVHDISGAGTTVAGITMTTSSPNIFNNKIYAISSTSTAAPIVSGLLITSLGTNGVANVYNNIIGNLSASTASSASAAAPTLRGINITVATANSNINVAHNSVYLNTSSTGTNFASTALFVSTSATATTGNLTLNNNVFVNLSTPSGLGNAVAFQRSTTALNNYDLASNNNLFYAGTPSAQNLIFFDGTNAMQTLNDFKCVVSTRETSSVTENPSFLSTTGSDAGFLHINTAIPTQIESGGISIASISNDFDGDIRQGNAGYTGTGTAPDLGADEGNFISSDQTGPLISYNLLPNTICFNSVTLNADITDISGVNITAGTKPRLWFKKSTENNVLPATNSSADNGWKFVEASNNSTPFTFTFDFGLLNTTAGFGDVIDYFVVAQDLASTPNVSSNTVNYIACGSASSVALSALLFPVSAANSFTIISPPNPVSSSASPTTLCLTGNSTVTLGTDLGAEYQWESSPAGANNFSPISGAIGMSYDAIGLTSSMEYRCLISCNSIPVLGVSPSTVSTVVVSTPQVLSTNPASACSTVPVSLSLSATANGSSILNWYDSPSGGSAIASGDTFNTPLINSTTTYYVSASDGGGAYNIGLPAALPTATSGAGTTNFGIVFDALSTFTLRSVVVYAIASVAGTAGTVTIDVVDGNGVVLHSATVPVTGNPTAQAVGETVFLNFNILPGTNLKLRPAARSTGITGLLFEPSASAPAGNYGYPFSIPGVLTLNQSTLTAPPLNTPRLDLYYYFYNWRVETGCETPRVPVIATVNNGTPATSTDTRTACGSFNWIDGNNYTSNNNTATFTIVGGAASGCDSIVTLNLTINPSPTAAVSSTSSTCSAADGSATVTPSNGTAPYSISWSNGQTDATVTGLAAGSYDVTVTDNIGCEATASAVVTAGAGSLTLSTASTDVNCTAADGTATVTPANGTAPYSISWSNAQTDAAITGLVSGNYTVTVSDNNGCVSTGSVTVGTDNGNLVATVTPADAICTSANGSAVATNTGGTAPFSYNWSNGGNTNSIIGLVGGTYDVTISDANGCESTASAIVATSTGNLSLSATTTQELCTSANGTATVSTTGGTAPFSFVWSNGNTDATATGLSAGAYTATVTDANGCVETSAVTVGTNSGTLTATASTTAALCLASTGSATAVPANGTAPYAYIWSNGGTDVNITGLAAGTYAVTINDANGCETIINATVNTSNGNFNASATASNALCTAATGTATATVNNGTAPISYVWNNAATTSALNNLAPGNYAVTATDANGCVSTANATVGSDAGNISATSVSTDVTANAANDGTIDLTVSGGTAPISYLWSNGETTEDLSGLVAGNYSVTITDANGCEFVENVTINQPPVAIALTASNWTANIFPNPADKQTMVAVELGTVANVRIRLVNSLGQIIQSVEYSDVMNVQHSLNVSDLPAAMYMVEITADGVQKVQRLVVTRK